MRRALLACALLGCGSPRPSAPSHELVVRPEPPRNFVFAADPHATSRAIEAFRDHNGGVRVSAHAPDLVNDAVRNRLTKGLVVYITWRVHIVEATTTHLHAYGAHGCRVSYDLWNEVFAIATLEGAKSTVANLKGVERTCLHLHGLPLNVQRTLVRGARYRVTAIAEIDSPALNFANLVSASVATPLQPWVGAAATRVMRAEFMF